jgi:hypothetical protein
MGTSAILQPSAKRGKTIVMKPASLFQCVSLMAMLSLSGCSTGSQAAQTAAPAAVTYQTFYDNLSPYGTWIDYPAYGHVWAPRLTGDFRPYATNGNWAYTTEGWTWVSDYAWGWAPFHYGQWLYDDMYGWLWIPGYDWSPAWVTWGFADNLYCWAPLMPGIDLNVPFGSWRPHSFYWNAVSRDHIYDKNLSASLVARDQVGNLSGRISIVSNFTTTSKHSLYYSKGPDVNDVQKYVGSRIQTVPIRETNSMADARRAGDGLSVYRPAVQTPKETAKQHPEKTLQPREFRRASAEQSRPISTEDQRPMMERTEQAANIDRLPVFRSGGGFGGGGRAR